MGPPLPGFRLIWDATPFDAAWVLLPGLLALVGGLLLGLRARSGERAAARRGLGAVALLLSLAAVWWTLGGIGAWRAGAGRLASGTADFVAGEVSAPLRDASGRLASFQVQGRQFRRVPDAFLPPLHAVRWPAPALADGERVRVWFFGDDILRLEVEGAR